MKDFFTVNELALVFQTSPETIRKWIKNGKLDAIKGNSKKEGMRITPKALQIFLSHSPKYTKIAYTTALVSSITGIISLPGSIIVSDYSKELIKLLKKEITEEEEYINNTEKKIKDLQNNIQTATKHIHEIKEQIKTLKNSIN